MARVFPGPWKAAATAESLTATQARQLRTVVAPLLQSVLLWSEEPAQAAGWDEAALKAGFTELQAFGDGQIRATMRVVAALTDAVFVAS